MKKSKSVNIILIITLLLISFITISIMFVYNIHLNKINIQMYNIIYFCKKNKLSIFFIEIVIMLILYINISKTYINKLLFVSSVIIFNSIYIYWRIKYTLPIDSKVGLIIGGLLLICELFGFFQSITYAILFFKPYKLKEMKFEDLNHIPMIDVLIMTYDEPIKVLRKTIAGCKNIDYPNYNIYICDDGHRIEIKELAKFFNINYITREDNKHAKAGNINNALQFCKGELFSVLDADMIPKPNYLKDMVGYFKDNNVGFVQSPQVFYNADPFQHNLNFNKKIPNEQDFFMREVQSGRARYNALFHVGTNALFNRDAINKIGGIPTGSITEDMATGMILQSKGYKSIFVNKVLAVGLSTEYYKNFIKQRKRWCRGNIQVSKKWNPLTMKGLNITQKLLYISGILYWYSSISKMLYILCPIIYLLTGTLIIKTNTLQLLQFFVPSYLSYILLFKSHHSKYRSLFLTHIYEIAVAPFLAISSLTELLFSKDLKFNVTAKGARSNNIFISWNLLLPQFILFICTIFGYGISLNKFINTNSSQLKQSLMINGVWSIYNLLGIVFIMLLSLEKPRTKENEYKTINLLTNIIKNNEKINCKILNMSDEEFNVQVHQVNKLDINDIIQININNTNIFCRILSYNNNIYNCRFINLNVSQYLKIIYVLYSKENGYYDIENKQLVVNESINNVSNNIFSNIKIPSNHIINNNMDYNSNINNNVDKNIQINNNISNINKQYMNLPNEKLLKDVLQLDDKSITILNMYNELQQLKEQIKKQ